MRVSETTRKMVWDNLVECSRLARYWGGLGEKMRKWHNGFRAFLGISAAISLIPALASGIPWQIGAFGAVGILVALIWEYVKDYGAQAQTLLGIRKHLGDILDDYRILWDEIENHEIGADDARERSLALERKISGVLEGIDMTTDEKLNRKSQKDAYKWEANRYAAG
ncbi:MAG: hypothetical protein OXN16_05010 [Gammaproteobacteria bacterium]|nr:hypothetical protein [Gammaproteobacteria bacterium]